MKPSRVRSTAGGPAHRRGIVVVLTGVLLVVIFAFVSLSIDSGRIVLTQTEMQNAVDAAALAAAQEITSAIHNAGQGEGSATIDANSIAVEAARQMAAQVADANGVYIDASTDVYFGKRRYDEATDTWPVDWGVAPYNVVKVAARRTGSDVTQPDGELPLAFGWAVGRDSVPVATSASAFVEARDLVLVMDFSGSMNDDSSFDSSLSLSQVESQLDAMWASLQSAAPKWPGTTEVKFPTTMGRINSAAGVYYNSTNTNTILSYLQLNQRNSNGTPKYPFPQAGRNSNGTPKSRPNASTSDNLWKGYIDFVKGLSGTYSKKYGYRTLLAYLQQNRISWSQSEDLWRTPHYPFTAVKNGASLFLEFLDELDFGDEVGLVSYATWAEQESTHFDGEVSHDMSNDPISPDYVMVDDIQRRHQAGHYDSFTGIGFGVEKARQLMLGVDNDPNDDGHSRYGARPTMILMTDGLANRSPSGWGLPSGFDWDDWTDYDGDGSADYTSGNVHVQYAFWQVTESVRRGVTVHTMGVGADADSDFLRAAAFAGGGIFISVPGGATIAAMEDQMREAFSQIAAKVPPAQLVYEMVAE